MLEGRRPVGTAVEGRDAVEGRAGCDEELLLDTACPDCDCSMASGPSAWQCGSDCDEVAKPAATGVGCFGVAEEAVAAERQLPSCALLGEEPLGALTFFGCAAVDALGLVTGANFGRGGFMIGPLAGTTAPDVVDVKIRGAVPWVDEVPGVGLAFDAAGELVRDLLPPADLGRLLFAAAVLRFSSMHSGL